MATSALPNIQEDIPSLENIGVQVGQIVSTVANDDDDILIGLAVVEVNNTNGLWEYREPDSLDWVMIPSSNLYGSAFLLPHNSWVRFRPHTHYFGLSDFAARAWDMTSDSLNDTFTIVDTSSADVLSGPYSDGNTSFTIEVVHENDPPQIQLNATEVLYDETLGSVQLFQGIVIVDVDNIDLQSATLLLECPGCSDNDSSPLASSGYLESSDAIIAIPINPMFALTTVFSDSLQTEYRVTPMLMANNSIESFTQFLQTLHFTNYDQEPSYAPRSVSLTVNDGTNSSSSVTVEVDILPVNDEVPTVTLPNSILTYVEDSGASQIFVTDPVIRDLDDNVLFNLSSATLQLGNADLDNEQLSVDCSETPFLTCVWEEGVLEIRGSANVSVYEKALGRVVYDNRLQEPLTDPRVVNITVFDGFFESPLVQQIIEIELINDQLPMLEPLESSVVFVEANPLSPPIRVGENINISDQDSGNFPVSSLEVELIDPRDFGEERLGLPRNMRLPRFVEVDQSNPFRITFSRRDNANMSTMMPPRTGLPLAVVQSLIRAVLYFNRATQPTGENRTILFTVYDNLTLSGVQPSESATVSVDLVFIDDLPEVQLNRFVVTYSEGQEVEQVPLAPDASVTDVDDSQVSGLLIQLMASTDEIDISQEILRVQFPTDLISESTNTTGTDLEIWLVGIASTEVYSVVLRSLTYEHTVKFGDPDTGNRIIRVIPYSLQGQPGVFDDVIITFTSVDNPPILDLNGPLPGQNFEIIFEEEGEPVPLVSDNFTLIDVDTLGLESIVINLSLSPDGYDEAIFLERNVSSSVTVEQENPFSIALRGVPLASVEELKSLLRTLRYINAANEPSGLFRTISITASDGNNTVEALAIVTIMSSNDSPLIYLNGNDSDFTTTYVEEGSPFILAPDPQVIDPDSLLVEIRIYPFVSFPGDQLSNDSLLLQYNSMLDFFFITLAPSTSSEVEQLLKSILFSSTLPEPSSGERLYCFEVVDSEQLVSNQGCTTITFQFVNDNVPTFDQSAYSAEVRENLPNTFVASVTANDADSVNSNFQLTYSIVAGDDCMFEPLESSGLESGDSGLFLATNETLPCRFSVDNLTGELVTTSDPPDREAKDSYILTLSVSDGVNIGYGSITITILDDNDVAPIFDPEFYNATIPFGAEANFTIATLNIIDPDLGRVDIFLATMDPPIGLNSFGLDEVTGRVYLLVPESQLDPTVSQYTTTYSAFDQPGIPNQSSNEATLVINVVLNNADPVFGSNMYSASVLENAPLNTTVLTIQATDSDFGSNAELRYSLDSLDIPFSVDPLTGVVYLSASLDFETTTQYTFIAIASDMGRPTRSAMTNIQIQVENVNEFVPQFTQMVYTAVLCEGVPVGHEVLQVIAVDSDSGSFGEVEYSILAEENCINCIRINSTTGVVTVSKDIDFETYTTFRVFVSAMDGGFFFGREADVVITILNDNEYPPVFQFDILSLTISETYSVGNPLPIMVQPLALDMDACDIDMCDGATVINNGTCSPSSSGLTYSILSGNEENLFEISPSTGNIVLSAALDFDTAENRFFALLLLVTDGEFSSTAEVQVTITDANDNQPVFDNASYVVSIPEDTSVGVEVLQVNASDADPTSQILFSVTGAYAEHFSINVTSGSIMVAVPLDFEIIREYQLVVIAMDSLADDGNNGTAAFLNIALTDVNDVTPQFTQQDYTFFVEENEPAGVIGMVEAIDLDTVSPLVQYEITSVNPGNISLFSIDSVTGEITANVVFDREQYSSYSLSVEAKDNGTPQLTGTAAITVLIEDRNDNIPVLSQDVYNVTIPENVSIGVEVLLVEATDLDAGSNGELTFTIVSGNNLGHFIINTTSGSIQVNQDIDRETLDQYILVVQASDSGIPSRTSTAVVHITVTDEGDNPPVFVSSTFFGEVFENSSRETFILQVQATDIDLGLNAEIQYTLISSVGQIPFTINPISGEISVDNSQFLDREVVPLYQLNVEAFNPNYPLGARGSANVTIQVLDVNDESPNFTTNTFVVSLGEDFTPAEANPSENQVGSGSGMGLQPELRYVTTVSAVDRDEVGTLNSAFTFSIVNGDIETFTINPSSGDISAIKPLDREVVNFYQLEVEAVDMGTPPQSSSAYVNITVLDINDNSPSFTDQVYRQSVVEDISTGIEILRVSASDIDTGLNADYVFTISDLSVPFTIDPDSGLIAATSTLDREQVSFYTFPVIVTDLGTPSLSSSAIVEITVLDVNDNQPVVTPDMVTVNISEDTAVGTIIASFIVTDADEGSNALSNITLEGGTSSFTISEDGVLIVSGPLDYETAPVMNFFVIVRNTEPPHLYQRVPVTVELKNVNDNPPVVMFGTSERDYFERVKQLNLDLDITIVDDDGREITRLVDGIVEFEAIDDREPSYPFQSNTEQLYLPYDCPLEDNKSTKLEPCGIPLEDEHIFTRPTRDLLQLNLESSDLMDDTILFNAAQEQYVYSSISSTFTTTGLTIFTWIWLDPVPNADMTIVSKTSPTTVLYSLFCSSDLSLNLLYNAEGFTARTVTFEGGCTRLQNAWHHLAVVLDNSNPTQWLSRVYIDSEFYGSQPMETPVDTAGSVFVGTRTVGGINSQRQDFFNGRLHLLVHSYSVSDANNINCAIGCGVSLRSSQVNPTLDYYYDYNRRALIVNGTNPIEVYESFFNSLVLILPLFEPVSDFYRLDYTVQDDVFNCLPMDIRINLQAQNDFKPTLSLSGNPSPDNNYITTFTEEMGPVPVLSQSAFFLNDSDLVAFDYSITVQIVNPQPTGSIEVLTVENVPNEINVTYQDYVMSLTGNLNLRMFESVVRTMHYNNLDDEPAGDTRQLLFTVIDSPFTETAMTTIHLVPVNDLPQVNLQFRTTEYREGQGAFQLLEDISITDSDNTTLLAASVYFIALDGAEEVLMANVSNTSITSTYDATSNTLTLQGEDSILNYMNVLISLSYEHLSTSDPTPGTRVLTFIVSDGISSSAPVEAMIFFDSINDPPVLDLNGPQEGGFNYDVTFVEDEFDSVPVTSPEATLMDVDNTSLVSVNISLTPVLDVGMETITVMSLIDESSQQQLSDTVLFISNNSQPIDIRLLESVIQTVRYQNVAEEPTGGIRVIEFIVSDGLDTSIPVYTRVTVQPANDAPVVDINTLDSSPGYETTYTEEAPPVYVTSRNVSISDNDVDASIETVMIVINNAVDGSFERIESNDENVTVIEQSPIVFVVTPVSGSLDSVEGLLLTLTYRNTAEEPTVGERLIAISISDGTHFSNSEIVRLNVESINEHSPQFSQPSYSRSVLEEQPGGLLVATVSATDRDGGLDGVVNYNITNSDPLVGLLLFTVNASGDILTTGSLDREMYETYNLTVSATDGGVPQLEGLASVLITVLDVNDQLPVFSPNTMFNLTVNESRPLNYTIDTVQATDADTGPNAFVSYALESSDPSAPFDVLSDGQIVVFEELDADTTNTVFTITVIASDSGIEPLSATATFTITVLDVNDNSPQFVPDSNYTGTLQENLPASVSIVRVNAIDNDSGSNAELRFILDSSSAESGFMIEQSTGEIFSTRSFDREDEEFYYLTVFAIDSGSPSLTSTALVTVTITDQNDVRPVFNQSLYSAEVQENVLSGTFVLAVRASDGDLGSNANITYSIVPNEQLLPLFSTSPLFSIDSISGDIYVNELIDFELQPVINFTVEAIDQGSPMLTGTTRVSVNVIDDNDNSPVFNQTLYEAAVPENEANYIVVTIEATDADSDENGRVAYRLLNSQDKFIVDQMSGEIRTVDGLDFEADCFYRLVALAEDSGLPSLNATVVIDVSVMPLHDVPPSFSPSSYSSSISENMPPGISVIQVSATDGDLLICEETQMDMPVFDNPEDQLFSGTGPVVVDTDTPMADDSLEYFLLNYEDLFTINRSSGLVTTLVSLDRETMAQYTLRIQARDPSGLTAEATVTVNIMDVNDNSPRFLQPSYTVATSENSPIGTSVLQVIASDPDFLDQGRLVYRLSNQPSFLDINSQSGIIFTTSIIDFETISPSVNFFAVVTDTRGEEASALVRVIITNVADLPPVINTRPQTLTFTEGNFSLRPFPQISITDPDNLPSLCNATITLISPENNLNDINVLSCTCSNSTGSSCSQGCVEFIQLSSSAFSGDIIQSMSGSVLVLSGELPIASYEDAISSIEYINLITNPVAEARTVSVSVNDCLLPSNTLINTINIQPINMHPPVVDLNGPTSAGNDFVAFFRERGDAVLISSPNATITDADITVGVEQLTGLDVSIVNPLDGEQERLIYPEPFTHPTISVTRNSSYSVSFRGLASLSDYEELLVQLLYDNGAPEPDPSPRMINTVAIEYHLTSNISVTIVNIIPSNDHPPVILTSPPLENNIVSYSEGSTGILLTSPSAVIDDADSTADPITELQVYVYGPSTFDRIFLQPGFVLPSAITVDSMGSNTSLIFHGEAPSEDYEAIVRSLTYQYTGDEFENIFPPKFIYLQVSDTRYSSFSAVQVSLSPVNDQVPIFLEKMFMAETLPENSTVGFVVIQVVAVDGDRFTPSDVRYSIVAGNDDGTFSISERDGTITLARTLDFETTPMYNLVVQATDEGYSGSSVPTPSQAAVVIPVGDVNDHVPMFNSSMYNATVGEGAPIGTAVLQLYATDRDSEAHSVLKFELVSDSSDFVIDRQSGVIFTANEIDRETRSSYMLFATVRNPGSSAFDAASVSITVLDLDDNPPVINLQQDLVVLKEPATEVILANNLTITDSDPNPSLDYALVQILPNTTTAIGHLVSTVQSNTIEVTGNGSSKLEFRGESQSLSEYTRVLRGVLYRDTSEEPSPSVRMIAYQVGSNNAANEPLELLYTSSEVVSNVTELVVAIELLNDQPPVLLLDSRNPSTIDYVAFDCIGLAGSYSTNFTEDEEPVLLSHSSFSLTDADSGETTLQYALVQVVNPQDFGFERLSAQLSGQVTLSSASDDLQLILEGPASIDDFTSVLRSIRLAVVRFMVYTWEGINRTITNKKPVIYVKPAIYIKNLFQYLYRYQHDNQFFPVTNSDRRVSFVINDGAFNSTPVSACIRLTNINDVPILTLGPNSTVDVVVMYTEGQAEPLFLAPDLEIEGINTLRVLFICTRLCLEFYYTQTALYNIRHYNYGCISIADADSLIASAVIVLPPLSGNPGATEQLDVMSPQSLTVSRLPGQLILSASSSMESIQVFEQVLRTVYYSTTRSIS